jgi:hypothetical protein
MLEVQQGACQQTPDPPWNLHPSGRDRRSECMVLCVGDSCCGENKVDGIATGRVLSFSKGWFGMGFLTSGT